MPGLWQSSIASFDTGLTMFGPTRMLSRTLSNPKRSEGCIEGCELSFDFATALGDT